MHKLLLAITMLSLPVLAATPAPATCCKTKDSCGKDTCCSPMDNCCKATPPKPCMKQCAVSPTAKGNRKG